MSAYALSDAAAPTLFASRGTDAGEAASRSALFFYIASVLWKGETEIVFDLQLYYFFNFM